VVEMMIPDRQNAIKILNKKYSNSRFQNPEEVVLAWKNFVESIVSDKYNGTENEYWNDLDLRMIIEEIGYDRTEEVNKIDENFRNTLTHTNVRNWGYDDKRNDDWWNFGYPSTIQGYLKDNFESDIRFKN
jgi:hypothetical protein